MADESVKDGARGGLVDLAAALLVGPLKPDELLESAPADTYLTGILWPQDAPLDASEDEGQLGSEGAPEDGEEAAVPGYRAVRPCSLGLTFAVDRGSRVRVDLAQTARYMPEETLDDGERESGAIPAAIGAASPEVASKRSPRRTWRRKQLNYSAELVRHAAARPVRISKFLTHDGGEVVDESLSIRVKCRVGEHVDVYTVTLVNELIEDRAARDRDSRCLFQAGLNITSSDGRTGCIRPRPGVLVDAGDDEDALSNALLYREVHEFAAGHGVAAAWNGQDGDRVRSVETTWMPKLRVSGTTAEGHASLMEFRRDFPEAFRAGFLADDAKRPDVLKTLDAFAAYYGRWIQQSLESRVATFQPPLDEAARKNLKRAAATADRIQGGVEYLRANPDAWTAFALANAAMDCQANFPVKGPNARPLVWRPFQLAYMLLVIPGLSDPALDDRNCMDLLWFPTGGGKTEAYLALTAYQIFLRRLREASARENGGVDVLMRYTLRLLTVQQFQRASSLICACDAIRKERPALGKAPISIGLYVGRDSTPNSMEDARVALAEERSRQNPKSTPRQLLRCPICGADLFAGAYRDHPQSARIDICCGNKACPSRGEGLPVLTVDEIIYSSPPSLLIGTIDKFAQMPRRDDLRAIFGLNGGMAPGLIIQDELHLISGPLGSMAGLYEAAVDLLCTRGDVRPKIIGSTATIGQAANQVRALFDREVLQFPPPGFDAGDSFFAVRDVKGPDRMYVGLSTAGRSPKFALQALIATLSQSVAALAAAGTLDPDAKDWYWTCVAYFNSLRELGGADVLVQDDVPRQMQFLASRLGMDRRSFAEPPMELSSRRSSRELPQLLQQLSTTLGQYESDPMQFGPPPDNVLASNMISVGVDVPRLGLMVVNGQPKSTAEYIQASSRVGRGIPGLVFTLYNFGRPRDVSHFEHFAPYHEALYRNVEATSVTPWAPRARDKALHAAVAAAVRHLIPGLAADDAAVHFDSTHPEVVRLISALLTRVGHAVDSVEADETRQDIQAIVAQWARRSHEARVTGSQLRYWERKAPFGRTVPALMSSAEEGGNPGALAWATPNTMREVEPSSAFILKKIPARAEDAHGNV